MYARLDNHFDQHPKIIAAGYKAAYLFTVGICYSSRMLTDGFIPSGMVPRLVAGMPGWKKAVAQLVLLGLWQEVEGGYAIHDYLDFQESRADVERKRQNDRARKATDETTKAIPPPLASAKIPRGIRTEAHRNLRAIPTDSSMLDRDVDVNTDQLTDQTDHDQEAHGQKQKTPDAAKTVARPEMAALVSVVRDKAHLAPDEDDDEVARTVQMHLDLWPAEVLEDQAQAFDDWASKIERKGQTVARTATSLGTFFGRIDGKKLARARRSVRNPPRAEPPEAAYARTLAQMGGMQRDGPRLTPRPVKKINGHYRSCACNECQVIQRTARHPPRCNCHDCFTLAPLRVREQAHITAT